MVQNNVQSTRHDGIVEAVIDAGSTRIDELAELFDVSRMTVHRARDALEARRPAKIPGCSDRSCVEPF